LNLRPSGYEPDELPDCSTPQQRLGSVATDLLDFKSSLRASGIERESEWPGTGFCPAQPPCRVPSSCVI